jgi:formamidopyrimidine-DNA glycosylase
MAEVPEVETLTGDLRHAVAGRTILRTEVLQPAAIRFPAPQDFEALLTNRAVLDARRRGKHILVELSGNMMLEMHMMHMMLWGTIALMSAGQLHLPETLIVWRLDHDEDLRLSDKLGYARASAGTPDDIFTRLNLNTIGPDALDSSFTVDVLAQALAKRRGVLRTVLVNQRVIAGLGIRDADESLWMAGIDPRRAPMTLNTEETVRLHHAIVKVLKDGLALRGTQRDLFGRKGLAKHGQYVFEQAGKPCPRCGTPVAHVRIADRNAFFCPACQH